MEGSISLPRVGAGRPTKAQAEARHAELLDSALDHFLEKGFEQATIEAIAASVGMAKRTIYARYPEKVALFRAAVRRAIDRAAVPEAKMRSLITGDLEQTLANIARVRVERVMTPAGLKLQRIINIESYRFPDIFVMAREFGTQPILDFLADYLADETKAGRLAVAEPQRTANVFLTMVVSGPVRTISSGNPLPAKEIDMRIRFAVRMFLDGVRPR